MATTLKQIQAQKQKLAPRQVLQGRLLLLNTMNLEQAIKVASLLGANKLMATGTSPFLLKGLISKLLLTESKQKNYSIEGGLQILYKRGDELIL